VLLAFRNRSILVWRAASIGAANVDRLVHPTGAAGTSWWRGGVVLALGVTILLGHRVYQLEADREPLLILTFDARYEFMRLQNDNTYLVGLGMLYVLVLPVVQSKKQLRGCVGRLAGISVFNNGCWTLSSYGASIKLRWQ